MKNTIVFLLFLTAASFALTNVSGCQEILGGDTFVLTQDLVGNNITITSLGGNSCIHIRGSNVLLDCAGHTLTGTGALQTFGIVAGPFVSNVTIRNCTVSNYSYGILSQDINGLTMENNEVFNASNSAYTASYRTDNVISKDNEFHSSYTGFIWMLNNNDNLLSVGDHIHHNSHYGIALSEGNNGVFANGTVEENGEYDVYTFLAFNSSCNFSLQNITGSGGRPIMLVKGQASISDVELSELLICNGNGISMDNVTVDGSDSLDNNGIFIQTAFNVNITNSSSNDNEYGIFSYRCNNLMVDESEFSGNELDGINTFGSNDNSFTNLDLHMNGRHGMYLNINAAQATVTDNSANGNGENGFYIFNSGGVFTRNNASANRLHGVHFFINNMTIHENNMSGNNGSGMYMESSDFVVYENNYLCANNISGLDLAKSVRNNIVRNNIGCMNGEAGFAISSFKGASNDNVIANNSAFGNTYGFVINSSISSSNNVTDNNAWNNTIVGFGARYSSGSRWERNNATGSQAGFLFRDGAHGHLIRDNVASDGFGGFIFIGSSDNVMENCLAYNNNMAGFYEMFGLGHGGGTDATRIVNSQFYDNAWEIVQASAYGRQFNVTNTTLGSDSVRFSLLDSVNGDVNGLPAYMINETGAPGPVPSGNASFLDKYLKIWFQSDNLIDGIALHWDDDEAQGFDESSMMLLTWNGTGWIETPNQILDEGGNWLAAFSLSNITEDDYYGLFVASPAGGGDDDDGDDEEPLSIGFEKSCEGNVVTVTSGEETVDGARVVMDGLLEGYTDGDGEFGFHGCGESILIYVNKNGYLPAQKTVDLVDCSSCEGECTADSDCPSGMQCAGNECEEVPCGCGSVLDHECVPYECCDDSGCGAGQACLGNACVDVTLDECSSESECLSTEYCLDGECADVSGECGYAENHTWVSYECGDDESCPRCASGFSCENNVCIEYDVKGPDSEDVGKDANITVSKKGGPCVECDLQITSPSGKKSVGKTDESGNFELGLLEIGEYKIVLVKDGETVAGTKVVSKGAQQEVPEQKPEEKAFDYVSLIVLVLIALAIILVIVFKRRK